MTIELPEDVLAMHRRCECGSVQYHVASFPVPRPDICEGAGQYMYAVTCSACGRRSAAQENIHDAVTAWNDAHMSAQATIKAPDSDPPAKPIQLDAFAVWIEFGAIRAPSHLDAANVVSKLLCGAVRELPQNSTKLPLKFTVISETDAAQYDVTPERATSQPESQTPYSPPKQETT